jgi:DNA gyrase/topoisomerase IV subunit A
MLVSLQQQKMNLQMAALTADTFNTFAEGTKAMKAAMGDLDVDKIDEIKDQNEEMNEMINEVTDLLGAPTEDNADLEDELEQLGEGLEDEPEASTTKAAPVEQDDDDEQIGDLMSGFA